MVRRGKVTQVVLESKRGLRLGAYQGHTYITGLNPGDSMHSAMDLRLSHRSEAMYISLIDFKWTSTEAKSFQ